MKPKARKQQDLEVLRAEFSQARSAFLVEFSGLKVVDCDDLRRKVRGARGTYRVVQNTLARKASEGTALAPLGPQFSGPTAVVTAPAEPASLAKVLTDFAKANPAVRLKAGVVEGEAVDAEQCKAIANLPSRDQLRAQLASALQAPLARLLTVLAAPPRNLAVVLGETAKRKAE